MGDIGAAPSRDGPQRQFVRLEAAPLRLTRERRPFAREQQVVMTAGAKTLHEP
jgi:hypothetical protein